MLVIPNFFLVIQRYYITEKYQKIVKKLNIKLTLCGRMLTKCNFESFGVKKVVKNLENVDFVLTFASSFKE